MKKLSEMEIARVEYNLVQIQKENEETISSVHALTLSIFKASTYVCMLRQTQAKSDDRDGHDRDT